MDRAAFVQKFGGIFVNSPWVAEQAWEKRPFASLDEMHATMVAVAKYAPASLQLTLLQSHPDLAGKEAQAGAMTASSVAEQASAGLNALSHDEMTQISNLKRRLQEEVWIPLPSSRCACTPRRASCSSLTAGCRTTPRPSSPTTLQNVYIITRLRLNMLLDAS
ncbi:MAG: 2-oxo-4-hydroxy-4-carboxy-5-ureidoimidazoline decarboxylase [Bradyrhizobium sp.]